MGSGTALNVYIGHDSREAACTYVLAHSISKRTKANLSIQYLKHRELRAKGLFNRQWLIGMGGGNETFDLQDGKTFSTEFSHTRFLVPHMMGYKGWALFMDADMVCLSDINKLFALCDDKYAVMCVKHNYPPKKDETKMDGRSQRFYRRKNWSSFVLWNCGHEANRKLVPAEVNTRPGAYLHGFEWLADSLIGELPFSYNYIAGVSPKLPDDHNIGRSGLPQPYFIHYSDGGPWFDECKDVPYAEWWVEAYEDWQRNGIGEKYTDLATTRYE